MHANPVKQLTKLFQNKNSKTILSVVLALYSAVLAPSVPNSVIMFVDSVPGKLLMTFLIAYVANLSVQVAIMLAVAFIVTLNVANNRQTTLENFFEPGDDEGDDDELLDEPAEEEDEEEANDDMDDDE